MLNPEQYNILCIMRNAIVNDAFEEIRTEARGVSGACKYCGASFLLDYRGVHEPNHSEGCLVTLADNLLTELSEQAIKQRTEELGAEDNEDATEGGSWVYWEGDDGIHSS